VAAEQLAKDVMVEMEHLQLDMVLEAEEALDNSEVLQLLAKQEREEMDCHHLLLVVHLLLMPVAVEEEFIVVRLED
jgi:hypothetical protein